jgi:hypothetical protein
VWAFEKARSPVCSGQKSLFRDSASGSAMAPEEALQLQQKLSQGARRRPRTKIMMAEDRAIWQGKLRSRTNPTIAEGQTIWQNRLRPRRGAIDVSCERPHLVQSPTGKPKGIVKQYGRKTPQRKRQTATKDQATTSITQNAGTSHLYRTKFYFNGASLPSAPARRLKNVRRQPVQPGGIQKVRSSKGRQTRRYMTALAINRNQGPLCLLPQSEV